MVALDSVQLHGNDTVVQAAIAFSLFPRCPELAELFLK
jgi:hypothetical protein